MPRVVKRGRLFTLIDHALARRVVWCVGPPGAGKTTLVASYLRQRRRPTAWLRFDEGDADLSSFVHYLALSVAALSGSRKRLPSLTPEYMMAPSIFLRRFLEKVAALLPRRAVIVFDNYQDLPRTAVLRELLPAVLDALGEHVSVFVLSREAPDDAFASLRAQGGLSLIPAESLLLEPAELTALVALYHPRATVAARRAWVQKARQASGWMAGVTLLLQERTPVEHRGEVSGPRQIIFSYLAKEAFARFPVDVQSFLLRTSLMPEFTAGIAADVADRPDAQRLLDSLHASRYFTERLDIDTAWYRYHPLFQECLMKEASTRLSVDETRAVRRQGGLALIDAGRLQEGLALLAAVNDWAAIADALLAAAPTLLAQGRIQTLLEWLKPMPDGVIQAQPWLLYWRAVCLAQTGSSETDGASMQARSAFVERGDAIGALASWSIAAMAIVSRMGDCSRLDPLLSELPFEAPESLPTLPDQLRLQVHDAIATAMVWRQPGTSRTERWVEYVIALKRETPFERLALSFPFVEMYSIWKGDLRAARAAFGTFALRQGARARTPLSIQASLFAEAVLGWNEGDEERCTAAVARGVSSSLHEGLVAWRHGLLSQDLYNAMLSGELGRASELIELLRPQARPGSGQLEHHHEFLEAWLRLHLGESDRAWQLVRPDRQVPEAYSGPFAAGLVWQLRSYIALAMGDQTVATECSATAAAIAESMNSDYVRHGAGFTEALCALGRGDDAGADRALRWGLAIGRQRGLYGCPGWHAPAVSTLLSRAMERGIERDYVVQLIRKRRLPRPLAATMPGEWAWPVSIRAFGGFDVRVDDAPITTARKSPHRLLEFLRAIIAFEGTEVPLHTLIDAFWPDVDGGTAQANCDKTLQRLRRLLEHPNVLPVRNGHVSLNSDVCWVDSRAFESLVRQATPEAASKAMSLYRGPLFSRAATRPWEARARERLERLGSSALARWDLLAHR